MIWDLEINEDTLISKTILKEEPIYLASGKKSKRTKIPFMDIWKKSKDGLKQCGFGLYKTSEEVWVLYFRTKKIDIKDHNTLLNKYYDFFSN
jgi:hypothetical protein